MLISIEIDDDLSRCTDARLALLWHVAQANPAPYDDKAAGKLVEQIGWEIIRRWLQSVPPELYAHQPKSYYWRQLTRFAEYKPGGTGRVNPGVHNPEWHNGTWVLKGDVAENAARASDDPAQAEAPAPS